MPSARLEVRAPLDAVTSALAGLGAGRTGRRTAGFTLAGHVLQAQYDDRARSTIVMVAGDRATETARWLAHQLSDLRAGPVRRS